MRPRAGNEVQNSARCQPKPSMSEAISGGASAAPSCRPMLCTPCTKGHLSGLNQASKTPAHTGKIGPWAAPSTNCTIQQRGEQCRAGEHPGQERRGQRRRKGDQTDHNERQARPEALTEQAAGELQDGVTDDHGHLEPAELHLADAQPRHHLHAGDRDAARLEVGDQPEAEQEPVDAPAYARSPEGRALRGQRSGAAHAAPTASPMRCST